MIKPTFTNIVAGSILFLLVIWSIKKYMNSFEGFEDDEPEKPNVKLSEDGHESLKKTHSNLPVIEPKELKKIVKTMTEALKNIIDERPDFVQAFRDTLKEPQIHKALMSILFDVDETSRSFKLASHL